MDKVSFLRHMEELLEISPDTLRENTKLSDISEWDSLALLGFIALVDSEMHKQLNTNDVANAQTFADLYGFLED